MSKPIVGDIVEVITGKGRAYAQVTHFDQQYDTLIRVFKGLHAYRLCKIDDLLLAEVQFSTFVPLTAMLKCPGFQIVGNLLVRPDLAPFPLFRAGAVHPITKKVETWWSWDGRNEQRIGKELSKDQKRMPIRGVWNDTLLIHRIESGWRSQDDL